MTSRLDNTVHFVEIGGSGGVFQHTLRVAELLVGREIDVVIHTAFDPEQDSPEGVRFCRCMSWFRTVRSRRLRQCALVIRYLCRTVPHLMRVASTVDVMHVQGASPLCSGALLAVTLPANRVLYSPHNTFSRSGSVLEQRMLVAAARRADVVVAFSQRDVERVRSWGANVRQAPLVQFAPKPDAQLVGRYRTRFRTGADCVVVGLFGQVRADKGGDQFVRAVAAMPEGVGVVVGQDLGGLTEIRAMAEALGLTLHVVEGYLPLEEFASAMSAVDVLLTPYRRASQSGVLSLARSLGVPTVSSTAGGLAELATTSVEEETPNAYVEAIRQVLHSPPVSSPVSDEYAVWAVYAQHAAQSL